MAGVDSTESRRPVNLRVYGVLLRAGRVLICEERVGGREVLKFPGGAVEADETPEAALKREFVEECALVVEPMHLLHAPGTLHSPWILRPYTPLFFAVSGDGEATVPGHEPLIARFMDPEVAIASARMAVPDMVALRRALENSDH